MMFELVRGIIKPMVNHRRLICREVTLSGIKSKGKILRQLTEKEVQILEYRARSR